MGDDFDCEIEKIIYHITKDYIPNEVPDITFDEIYANTLINYHPEINVGNFDNILIEPTNFQFDIETLNEIVSPNNIIVINQDLEIENNLRKIYSWEKIILLYKPFKIDGSLIFNNKSLLRAIGISVKLYQNWTERLIQCYCKGIEEGGDEFKEKWESVMKKNTNLLITQLKDLSKIVDIQIPDSIKVMIESNVKVDSNILSSFGISVSKIHNYKSNLNKYRSKK